MKDDGLTDAAPVGRSSRRQEMNGDDENQTEQQRNGGVHGIDDEHHDHGAQKPEQSRVPRKISEIRPENRNKKRGQVERKDSAFIKY